MKISIRKIRGTAITICVLWLSGCASIVNGSNQVLSVETRDKGEMVAGATCRLENPKGVFYVTTPGTITVHRAYDDLNIKCEKPGLPPGIATAKSSTKGMAFGNILFGGFIGGGVDAATGAAYDYPSLITVMMGENTTLMTPAATAATASNAASPPGQSVSGEPAANQQAKVTK